MDGVSAASAVIAVVSIAIQLLDSAKRLHTFVATIEDSPADIQDLALVSIIIDPGYIIFPSLSLTSAGSRSLPPHHRVPSPRCAKCARARSAGFYS
jgi:hypothetical protein